MQVVGFDCVDDESKPERRPTKAMPAPADWNTKHNAAYSYYLFYLYANLYTLNSFRCDCRFPRRIETNLLAQNLLLKLIVVVLCTRSVATGKSVVCCNHSQNTRT